jgi:hypothetical protein
MYPYPSPYPRRKGRGCGQISFCETHGYGRTYANFVVLQEEEINAGGERVVAVAQARPLP